MTDLLDERDFAAITITELVGRAKVTRPTFYQHFRDLPGIARAASLARLESAFPAEPDLVEGQSDAARASAVEHTALGLLQHLHGRVDFYRRVIGGASAVELYDDFVTLLETRITRLSRATVPSDTGSGPSIEDRRAVLSGGLTWLIIRWLHSDFCDHNASPVMARRVAAAVVAFT